ncbi:MAG TPA: T9SS type A sorting domain-containing protein [Bacteroidia bacterium]|nr:T9SS type A sorting domain-containing protein [Bacteroidia bacterium]HMW10933.1 T9SS type A sorting domain-containing protein [Bacteroidia bacterium]HMX96928.1 T9SS type A sorting domain-containing protein [Bacteroidia bacterium]HMY14386.1 T9SS type A sorting domain-containing protein [Bacteroidia bacterium]HMY64959.1 T9SS type A sorting domain-containing protein [Bacteroidia bacterium]
MKTKILLSFLSVIFYSCLLAQNVSIEGKQFKLNGSNFYPMIMNFSIEKCYHLTTQQYFISSDHSYGPTNDLENFDQTTCDVQIQNDFNHVATMGFNSIRIAGFYPTYVSGQGLVFRFTNHDLSGTTIVPLDPLNVSDPGMLTILPMYNHILSLANSAVNTTTSQPTPLKVIFIITGSKSPYDATEVTAWNNFLAALSTYMATASNANALLAYDLMNEPCYSFSVEKTKEEACSMFAGWYDIIKSNDPLHLVTIGSCGRSDVFSADPAILKLDFLSLHYYPDWKEAIEDRTLTSIQDRMKTRSVNELYWINENSPMPWIVGETGFTANLVDANNLDWKTRNLHGTLADQSNYAAYSLDAVCNCGSSGYSWWAYQDVHYCSWPPNPPPLFCSGTNDYAGNFFGLLYWDTYPSTASDKPAATHFPTYQPIVNGSCPVDRTPLYDPNKLYYNSNLYPPNPTHEVTRTLIDQNGNPIKNAVVACHFHIGIDQFTNDELYDLFYTNTDDNGSFTALPMDYTFPYNTDALWLTKVVISAPGSERLKWDWCPGCVVLPPSPLTLKKIDFNYDGVLQNQTLTASTFPTNYKGWNTLTLTNVDIQPGFAGNFTARNEVKVNSEFHAANGTEVHLYCQPQVFSNCNDFQTFLMQRQASSLSANSANDEKQIEIVFDKITDAFISIFPNPNNGIFTVQLHDNNELNKIKTVSITNSIGGLVYSSMVNNSMVELNLSHLSKGIYYAKIITGQNAEIKKIIIN